MDPSTFQAIKAVIVTATGLSRDALHVYFGLTVFVLSALAFRKPLRALAPLLVVIAVACIGEFLDMCDDIATRGHWRVGASVHDLFNTTIWPVIVFLLVRYTRLFR